MARNNDKKDRLISAAARLFWQHGFQGASIKDIAQEAAVPLGNVYYYFPDKAKLALAVADIFAVETEQMLEEIAKAEREPRKRLVQLFEKLATSDVSRVRHGCPIALASRDFRDPAPDAASRAAEALSSLIIWIARQRQTMGERPSLALADARQAIVEWQGAITLAHALQEPVILAEAHRRIKRNLTAKTRLH
jgi:AcrR family transcriptional regulator